MTLGACGPIVMSLIGGNYRMTLITTPYWWGDKPKSDSMHENGANAPLRVDLAVIGAGFTGLSAAITGAEAGADVCVFDAGIPGQGASTRNGGMIGAPHRPDFAQELKTYGRDLSHRLVREGVEGYAHTRDLYTNGDIDARFQSVGRVQMAFTRAHLGNMRARAALLNGIVDQGIQVLDRDELRDHMQTDMYFGGLYYPDHGGLDPKRAHDGLWAKAVRAGAQIHAQCPVTQIVPQVGRGGDGFLLKTPKGNTWARRLVVASNGYTTRALGSISRRIFRVPSFIIATQELPKEVMDRVAPGRRMMVESRARHSYFRPSPDGKRILFGGRASMVPMAPARAARVLHATMTEIWPEAADWGITHCWQGFVGFSFAMNPHVGERDGAHFALGYCGNGVALSPWLGRKAALRALGDARGATAFAETRFETRPYHNGGYPWFMQVASPWWRHVVDRIETRQAAKDRRHGA